MAGRMARKIGLALLIAGGGSVLYGVYMVVHSILARRLGLGFFEPNLAPFLTVAGLLVLSVGILLLAIPKPAWIRRTASLGSDTTLKLLRFGHCPRESHFQKFDAFIPR